MARLPLLSHGVHLLAAGRGRRAGGPKAWQPCGGRSLLERQVAFLTALFDPEDISVSIQEPWLERCRALSRDVRWVPVDPGLPALGALQRLVRQTHTDGWAFVYHVDMPVWEKGLFESLSRAVSAAGAAQAVVPARDGKGGHPVLLSTALARRVLAADPLEDRLDRMISRGLVHRVEVPFACIRENWNEVIPP